MALIPITETSTTYLGFEKSSESPLIRGPETWILESRDVQDRSRNSVTRSVRLFQQPKQFNAAALHLTITNLAVCSYEADLASKNTFACFRTLQANSIYFIGHERTICEPLDDKNTWTPNHVLTSTLDSKICKALPWLIFLENRLLNNSTYNFCQLSEQSSK